MRRKSPELTEKEIQKCRNNLLREKEELLNKVQLVKSDVGTDKNSHPDVLDLASSEVNERMNTRLGNRDKLYFKKVEQALLNIKEGTYGECTECGDSIRFLRLIARPTAELCISCKQEEENKEKLSMAATHHKSSDLNLPDVEL